MANFKGYLFARVDFNEEGEVVGTTPFPTKYMAEGSWKSLPNSREEIKAYRDDNTRELTRITAEGTKSSFSFSTRPSLHLADKIEIQKFFTDGEVDWLQRKLALEYWNDEDNEYYMNFFYRADINFKINTITDDDIIYDAVEITLVEY